MPGRVEDLVSRLLNIEIEKEIAHQGKITEKLLVLRKMMNPRMDKAHKASNTVNANSMMFIVDASIDRLKRIYEHEEVSSRERPNECGACGGRDALACDTRATRMCPLCDVAIRDLLMA